MQGIRAVTWLLSLDVHKGVVPLVTMAYCPWACLYGALTCKVHSGEKPFSGPADSAPV